MSEHRAQIVLLHGFTGTPRIWDEVVADLEPDFDVHALPIAGHRGAGARASGFKFSLPTLVDRAASELSDRGLHRPHLVGNSLGGWMALELAARAPAGSVLALSPAGFWKGAADTEYKRVRGIFSRAYTDAKRTRPILPAAFRIPLVRRFAFRGVGKHGERLSQAAALEAVDGVLAVPDFEDLIDAVAAGAPHYDLDCPVAVRIGEHDGYFPLARYSPEVARRIPTADIAPLPGVGHVPMVDDPGLVAEVIRAWVRKVERSTA